MECCKLFDSRVLSSSLEILGSERLALNRARRSSGGGISPNWLCSCKGISVKASYSAAKTSSQKVDSISQNALFLESESPRMNGVKGPCSSTLRRREDGSVLDYNEDEYEGVVVNPAKLPSNPNSFASLLRASLSHWKIKRKKGIWLKLPLERSDLVPIAVKEGFEYHHAERSYVMLTYWIPEAPSMLPSNASHQVGVGGFVLNHKNEVLVVQEKHCLPRFNGIWKLPTGFILESEEIYDGVIREVKEETGIDTEFVEVIAFRHAHCVAFDKSDLFFICMLRPLSSQIEIDNVEIQAAKWMPLVEFVQQQLVQGDSMFQKILDICIARLGKRYCGLSAHHMISKFDGKSSSLYYNIADPQDFNCPGDSVG